MCKPHEGHFDGHAASWLGERGKGAAQGRDSWAPGRGTKKWCKRRLSRQDRHATHRFLAKLTQDQINVMCNPDESAWHGTEFEYDDALRQLDPGYITMAEHEAMWEAEERWQQQGLASVDEDPHDPYEYDYDRYDPYEYDYDRYDPYDDYAFDRWSDVDRQERDLNRVIAQARSLVKLYDDARVGIAQGEVLVHDRHVDGHRAVILLRALGLNAFLS